MMIVSLICSFKITTKESLDDTSFTLENVAGGRNLSIDPEAEDCTQLLAKFRADEIDITETKGEKDYKRSFATINKDTKKQFYVATHDKAIDSIRADIMKDRRYYEFELTQRVSEIFEEKSTKSEESIMLDVGANIGWFSLVAAAHGATKVYSFEPNLQNTVRFCESLSLNRWLRDDRSKDVVIPIAKGMGNREENRTLYSSNRTMRNPGSFTFQKEKAYLQDIMEGDKVVRVPLVVGIMEITTLDHFAERHGWFVSKPCIALLKLDVEHFELEVLQGAEKLLKSGIIEKIVMELKPSHSENAKSQIIKCLFGAGYKIYKHGKWMGPDKDVDQVYEKWEDLFSDVKKEKYGENVMFRLK